MGKIEEENGKEVEKGKVSRVDQLRQKQAVKRKN